MRDSGKNHLQTLKQGIRREVTRVQQFSEKLALLNPKDRAAIEQFIKRAERGEQFSASDLAAFKKLAQNFPRLTEFIKLREGANKKLGLPEDKQRPLEPIDHQLKILKNEHTQATTQLTGEDGLLEKLQDQSEMTESLIKKQTEFARLAIQVLAEAEQDIINMKSQLQKLQDAQLENQ